MPRILFQSDVQKARFDQLQGDVIYARRVVQDVAEPLIKARDRAVIALKTAAAEVGLPDAVQQFVVKEDGVYYAGPGQVWDAEAQDFVDPPEPEGSKPSRKSSRRGRRS